MFKKLSVATFGEPWIDAMMENHRFVMRLDTSLAASYDEIM